MGKKGDKSSASVGHHSPNRSSNNPALLEPSPAAGKAETALPSSAASVTTASNPSTLTTASPPVFSEFAMRNNLAVLEYGRTCQAVAAGATSGILGLTGIAGFVFYFVIVLIQALIWQIKSDFHWQSYFLDRWLHITHSLISGLFTYILFWVFLYGMVHVY